MSGFVRRWSRRLVGGAVVLGLLGGGALYLTGLGAEIHLDPKTTPARSTPNWALAAPRAAETGGALTLAAPTLDAPIWPVAPEMLIDALDRAALGEPRTERVAAPEGAFGAGRLERVYLQRSALIGYPDYVSAEAVDLSAGGAPKAALILYSRSVYGYSDMGVNAARTRRWIDAVNQCVADPACASGG